MSRLMRIAVCALQLAIGSAAAGQFEDFFVPDGAPNPEFISITDKNGIPMNVVATPRGLYHVVPVGDRKYYSPLSRESMDSYFGEGDKIIKIFVKEGAQPRPCALLENGDVWCVETLDAEAKILFDSFKGRLPIETEGGRFVKVVGDDLYGLTSEGLVVTHDYKTWQKDTSGLGKAIPLDIATDPDQVFWAAMSTGLMRRSLTASAWEKAPGFPAATYVLKVFCDRKGRVLAATFKGPMLSVDHGATFTPDSAGMGAKSAVGFGDDRFGNLYALVSPDLVYVSKGGTQPWAKAVQIPLLDVAADGGAAVSSITGDSLVFLSSSAGVFVTADQGATWARNDSGLIDPNLTLMRQTTDGGVIASTGLGLFRRADKSSAWTKVFPDSGTAAYRPFFEDSAGDWHTLGRRLASRNYPMPMVRSGMAGSWAPDTQGFSIVDGFNTPVGRDGFWFVDRQGRQYLTDAWTSTSGPRAWTKTKGAPWTLDTAGLGAITGFSMQGSAFGQDAAGNIYWAFTAATAWIMTRPASGGAWAVDTTGLGGAFVYSFAAGKDGKLWAGTIKGLYYREGGTWHRAEPPASSLAGMAAFAVGADKAGTIWAGFSNFSGYKNPGKGAYFSEDNGKTWKLGGLPNTTVRGFFAVGDTMRATTYGLGVYGLTRTPYTAGIAGRAAYTARPWARLASRSFGNRMRMELNLPLAGQVKVVVRDWNGVRKGIAFVGSCLKGSQAITLDPPGLAPGVYLLEARGPGGLRADLKFLR